MGRRADAQRDDDQAAGLRRLFTRSAPCFVPLVANPQVGGFGGVVLERLTTTFALGRVPVLLVDAASNSPVPSDLSVLELGGCIERLDEHTHYLAARGLPRRHVDSRGSAHGLLGALMQAAPGAAAVVVHADPTDLVRVFHDTAVRPLLLTGDRVESVKHAYAAAKLLVQRARLAHFDLLMCAAASRHARAVRTSLTNCLEGFIGAVLHGFAQIDPATDVAEPPSDELRNLLGDQLHHSLLAQHESSPHQRMHPMHHSHAWQATTT